MSAKKRNRDVLRQKDKNGKEYPTYYFYYNGRPVTTRTRVKKDAEAFRDKYLSDRWKEAEMGIKKTDEPIWDEGVVKWFEERGGKKGKESHKDVLRELQSKLEGKKFSQIDRDFVHDILVELEEEAIERERLINLERVEQGLAPRTFKRKDRIDKTERTSANATANRKVSAIVSVFNLMAGLGKIPSVPKFFDYPERLPAKVYAKPKQVLDMIKIAEGEGKQHTADIILYAVCTMHRWANVGGLRWTWIDWEEEAVWVPGHDYVTGDRTKTEQDIYIPLPKIVMTMLRRRYNESVKHITHVFHYNLKPIDSIKNSFTHVREKAGVPSNINFHKLRHTGNSWLAQRGVPKEIRQVLGGWAGEGDANERYTHFSIESLRPYVAIFDEIFNTIITTESVKRPNAGSR